VRIVDEAPPGLRGLGPAAPFSFEGEFYTFRDAELLPRPVQRPHPPFLLGGSGKGLLRIAARHADGVNIISGTGKPGYIAMRDVGKLTDASFRTKTRFLRDEAARNGRDPGAIEVSQALFTTMITESSAVTRETAEALSRALRMAPEEVVRAPLTLVGTPDECIAELRRRADEWKIAETIFSARSRDVVRRLAREILPHV